MGNLKVADSEYGQLESLYAEIGSIAEEQLETYFKCMNSICGNSLTEGLVYKNLVMYLIEAVKIRGVLKDITEELASSSRSFVEEIDSEDKYLY